MSKYYPKITIVTASYNQVAFIERTIQSVLSQNYPNLEYIIIDGGSTDGSVDIIKKYSDKLAYWCSEPDGGQYDAINKGFARSTGEIMGYLNADDIFLPWTFSTVASIFSSLPQVQWITSLNPFIVSGEGIIAASGTMNPISKSAFIQGIHVPGNKPGFGCIVQEGTFWTKKLWQESGASIDTSYSLAGDFDLWSRFMQYTELYCLGQPLAAMTRHAGQRSNDVTKYREECMASLKELTRKMGVVPKKSSQLALVGLMKKNRVLWALGRRWLRYSTCIVEPILNTSTYTMSWVTKTLRFY